MSLKQEVLDFIKLHQEHGKNRVVQWDNEGMNWYIDWAFVNNYLFLTFDKFGISGFLVAYPVFKYDTVLDILPKDGLKTNTECPIAIMDAVICNENARIDLTHKLMNRFTNWKNRDKVSVRYGKIKTLSNRYFELTGGKL